MHSTRGHAARQIQLHVMARTAYRDNYHERISAQRDSQNFLLSGFHQQSLYIVHFVTPKENTTTGTCRGLLFLPYLYVLKIAFIRLFAGLACRVADPGRQQQLAVSKVSMEEGAEEAEQHLVSFKCSGDTSCFSCSCMVCR